MEKHYQASRRASIIPGLPLAVPGLILVFHYTLAVCWQAYLFAITFVTSDELRTLPLVLNSSFGERATNSGGAMAAVFMSLPVAIVFLLLQRYFLQGLTAGSVKGLTGK
jgi:multiple sugar transport system permease protein